MSQSYAGPHRVLSCTWEHRRDTYVVTSWDQSQDALYNALVNFMYGRITGDGEGAPRFAEGRAVLARAHACGFAPTAHDLGGISAYWDWTVERS